MDANQWPMTNGKSPRGLSMSEARLVLNAFRRGEPYPVAPGMGMYADVVDTVLKDLRAQGFVTEGEPRLTEEGIKIARRLEGAGLT